MKLLYVSIINFYKHQWHVAQAVADLRQRGVPVELTFAGPAYPPALERLRRTLKALDPRAAFIRYLGDIPHEEIDALYQSADVFAFASSCESQPVILLEAMASGLPIACSNRGPMPEVLGEAGCYFDPERPESIGQALRDLIESPDLRTRLAERAYSRAAACSWRRCADETLGFIAEVAKDFR